MAETVSRLITFPNHLPVGYSSGWLLEDEYWLLCMHNMPSVVRRRWSYNIFPRRIGFRHPYTTADALYKCLSIHVVVKECLGGRSDNTPETSVEQQVQSNVVPGDIVSPADREVRIDRSYLDAL